MIFKAKHHFIIDPFLRFFVIKKMNQTFHSFNIQNDIKDKGLPILLICNHVSWWDGIWALNVNQTRFKRKFFFMMQENQLRKNWFLNYAGGYSISKKNKSITETINYTVDLLKDNNNMVLMFPQGEIGSMHDRDFIFHKGIEYILHRLENDIQIVLLANIIDYHSNVKPTVYSFMKNYSEGFALDELQNTYIAFFKECILEQIKIKT